MQGLGFSCRSLFFCFLAFLNFQQARSSSSDDLLPALAWLRERSNFSVWYDPSPPAKLLDGRLTRGMCEKRILPDSLVYDKIDWYTYGEKKGEWLQRYSGGDHNPICWGEGANADKWFEKALAGENCDRPWMVMSEEDVPESRFQQYTQEAPAVMGLDPLILEFCRNLTHDSRPVPHVSDPFWRTWKAAGMPSPEQSLGPMSTLESNLLQACGAANRNILRVSAMAQAKTSWDMCANVEWVVCAAKGKLPNQGKTIEFSVPPGNVDGNLAPTYREYRSNILRWSAHYEIDIMAWTFYLNEICFLSELCDNADELWNLKRGEPWVCKHTPAGEARLRDSLKNAYNSAENHRSVAGRMLSGGHVGGGHLTGGHVGPLTTTTATTTTTTTTTTTLAPSTDVGTNKSEASGISAGLIVLIVLSVLLCLVLAVVGVVVIKRQMDAVKRNAAPRKDMRQSDLEAGNATVVREPSRTLLDGVVHDVKKSKELNTI